MKKNFDQILLSVAFLFRMMVPLGNAAYLMCMVNTGKDTVWKTIFVVAILLDVAVMMAAGAGIRSPQARRLGAYGAFALIMIHFVAFMGLYVLHPACRQILTPLYMILFTLVSILMLSIANSSLLSVADMSAPQEQTALQEELPEII